LIKAYIDTNIIINTILNREDGVQYFCAIEAQCDFILTSNKKDFYKSNIDVFTPIDFYNEFMK